MNAKKILNVAILSSSFLCLSAAGIAYAEPRSGVDVIYENGTILTLNDSNDVAQAVAVQDGKIVAVGKNRDMRALAGHKTKVINLHRKTLIPGFYDAHSHIVAVGIIGLFSVDLNSPRLVRLPTSTALSML